MSVLITGGTGSLGTALVGDRLSRKEGRVVVYSRDEVKQAALGERYNHPNLRLFLGDVRDYPRLCEAMHGVEDVIHAAALKRVDSGAYNPGELVHTNVLGTWNVLRAAAEMGIRRVLLISSDKAVAPVNIYGATKLMAEFLTIRQNVSSYPRGTICSVLRYGNVWGSRGSVVLQFRAAAQRGERLRITHPEMTRYFITLPQAVSAVHWARDQMQGGEVFVPTLPAWRLADVAALFPVGTIIVGLRPGGEKMHEALLLPSEQARARHIRAMGVAIMPEAHEWRSDGDWFPARADTDWSQSSLNAPRVGLATLKQALEDLE